MSRASAKRLLQELFGYKTPKDVAERETDLDTVLIWLEVELHIATKGVSGALADAATVPTDDLERGVRALTAERDALKRTQPIELYPRTRFPDIWYGGDPW